jgi:hypothetical protein
MLGAVRASGTYRFTYVADPRVAADQAGCIAPEVLGKAGIIPAATGLVRPRVVGAAPPPPVRVLSAVARR